MGAAQILDGTRDGLDLVGEFRRFGPNGVVYEVVAAADEHEDKVEVEVMETGERLRYPVADARRDPRA